MTFLKLPTQRVYFSVFYKPKRHPKVTQKVSGRVNPYFQLFTSGIFFNITLYLLSETYRDTSSDLGILPVSVTVSKFQNGNDICPFLCEIHDTSWRQGIQSTLKFFN